jgi:hypothetical protein
VTEESRINWGEKPSGRNERMEISLMRDTGNVGRCQTMEALPAGLRHFANKKFRLQLFEFCHRKG